MENSKEEVDISKLYGEESTLPKEEFIKKYKVSEKGLSKQKANDLLKYNGLNEIKQAKPKRWYNYLAESLFSPFNCILLGIVCVLIYTDIYLPETPSYANIIVIAILVTASTFLEFFEEYRSNKAAEKLKDLVATTTNVIRDGKEIKIPINQVVLGDVVVLSAGSMIPADLRIIEAKDLYVGQSALTGESDSVQKQVETKLSIEEIDNISDLDNICFMGTNVVSGTGKGIVIKTGDSSYFGKVAHTISNSRPKTAFQKGIENISKLLMHFMLAMIPLVFLLNAWKHDIVTAFSFAVAIAITITPLLLPVILSSSLSKGAVRMSKKKTIVKKLDAVQNFGAMNILCTDKTGTLTEDKIVVEKYINVEGIEDKQILEYAYLNAIFQSGLNGSIDEAIIKKGSEESLQNLQKKFIKIDEIPFDFSRRRLSIIVKENNKQEMITKGAVEEILNVCTKVKYNNQTININSELKNKILKTCKELNKKGFRVLGICTKETGTELTSFNVSDEKDMTFIGFIGFIDPPKESAKESIEKLNKAGIRVIVLTGDNAEVTKNVCDKVGIKSKEIILGSRLDKLSDAGVMRLVKKNNIFAKLSPIQKARIIRILKEGKNVVGYMGDGINDGPSLTNSDVAISVDTAVDIAKETADIILLEKDLNVLLDGVTEGRRTFVNLMKYIKLSTSFNFGEVVSVIIASAFLPFLPETPIQLLVEGLLYDFGQMTLPFDNVDEESLKKLKKLDIKSLKHFMLFMGPVSSIFDIIVFISLLVFFNVREAATFQTIWFSYSIVSNLIGMHIIRTAKIPFVQSNAHKTVYISSILLIIIGLIFPFTKLGAMIGLVPIAGRYIVLIFVVTLLYCIVALIAKKKYIRKYKEWI